MVSSQLRYEIESGYDSIESQTLDLREYHGNDFDVIFEIISAETFIAGIASKLLASEFTNNNDMAILRREFIRGGNWVRDDGSEYSLWHLPDVLEYARKMESLRVLCLRYII